jgi:hypothetical protein
MNNKTPLGIILILVIVSFSLPIFQAGFYFDDAGHSVLEARRQMQGKSRLVFANETFDYMVSQQGRLAVTWSYIVLPLQTEIGDNLIAYRLIHFTAWAAALWSVVLMFRQLAGTGHSNLFLILILALIQFRNWHDGTLNYFLFVPLLLTTGSWTIIFWHRGLLFDRPLFTWLLAPFFYVLGLLSCNEFMLVFLPVCCAIAIFESVPLKLKISKVLPLLLVTLLYLSVNLWLKSRPTITYGGVSPGPISGIPKAYLIQLFSTIPLSCAIFNPNGFMTNWWATVSLAELCIALVGAIGAGTLTNHHLINRLGFNHSTLRRLLSTGATLLLVPPLLSAISLKYQTELRWGWGYLQITLQVVGLVLLLTAFLSWMENIFRRNSKWFTAAIFCFSSLTGLVFLGHSLFNQRLVSRLNDYDKTPRELCRNLLEHYSFAAHPEKPSRLLVDAPWLSSWEIPEYFYRYSKRRFVISTWSSYLNDKAANPQKFDESEDLYYMSCPTKLSENDGGVIVFGKLSPGRPSLEGIPRWELSHIMLATRSVTDMQFSVRDSAGVMTNMVSNYRTSASNRKSCSLYYHDTPVALNGPMLAALVVVQK